MNLNKPNLFNFCTAIMVVAGLFHFSGCALFDGIANYKNSTSHFLAFNKDFRIMYEPGAEEFAAAVSSELPSALKKVGSRRYSVFPDKIKIYVCKSLPSFKTLTGRDVSALTYKTRDLFVPRYASYWGIKHQFKHHMFYRQCMLFVVFLKKESPEQFEKFIVDIENGMDFPAAFRSSFGADAMTKWREFKNKTIIG